MSIATGAIVSRTGNQGDNFVAALAARALREHEGGADGGSLLCSSEAKRR